MPKTAARPLIGLPYYCRAREPRVHLEARSPDSAVRRGRGASRELEILDQIAAGKSTREIAQALFVSENTVKTHVSRVYDKLGVNRRTQAVQEARRLGLLP